MDLQAASKDQLQQWAQQLESDYSAIKAKQLDLDLTRGKPSAEQLSLSDAIDGILAGNYTDASGTDCRNYGGLDGINGARALGAEMMSVPASNVMAGGSSSLTLMHQAMSIVENADVEPNTVIAVMQKGYTLNGRLVRPAMVMVSKSPVAK